MVQTTIITDYRGRGTFSPCFVKTLTWLTELIGTFEETCFLSTYTIPYSMRRSAYLISKDVYVPTRTNASCAQVFTQTLSGSSWLFLGLNRSLLDWFDD
jgi:hypothetical protein